MRSRKRDWRCPLPPEGYMWHRFAITVKISIIKISIVEAYHKVSMQAFDARHERSQGNHPQYWENDPSYHWVAEAKRKKALTSRAKGRI